MLRARLKLFLRRHWIGMVSVVGAAVALLLPVFHLVSETALVSREKMRHQFALDTAASVEMANYADFLNRSAYVNGAFPQRIFYEGFHKTCIEKKNNAAGDCGPGGDRLYDILRKNGAFPHSVQAPPGAPLDDNALWALRFAGPGKEMNSSPPSMPRRLDLLTMQDALNYWVSWDDAQEVYKLYVRIYQVLGSVERGQLSAFKRMIHDHAFFHKAYGLNARDPLPPPSDGAKAFDAHPFNPAPYCLSEIMIAGNKPTQNAFQPYQIWAPGTPIRMPASIEGCLPGPGLFQAEAIPDSDLEEMRKVHASPDALVPSPGYPIVQRWRVRENRFGVDLNREADCKAQPGGGPCVHATVTVVGGRLWPDPTPKFQTRLHP